jgi:hydrogenase 3 maturation protease
MEPTVEWQSPLEELLEKHGPVHLVGAGNPIRKDDAVGLFIASELRKRLGSRPNKLFRIYGSSIPPERLLAKIESGAIIMFDAVEHNSKPGSIIFARLEDTRFGFFATHNIPFKLIPGLSKNLGNAFVLGIQPGNIEIGEGLSEEVLNSANEVVEKLQRIIEGVS